MANKYFSNTYGYNVLPQPITKKQHLFIDARDYLVLTNGTFHKKLRNHYSINTNEQGEHVSTTYEGDYSADTGNDDLSFEINLQDIGMPDYEQVEEVELKSIMFPKMVGEEYYILDIPEFSGRVHSTDKGSHDKFAVVYYDSSQTLPGEVKPMKGYDFDTKVHTFNPIKKRLSRFTVTFRRYGGNIITNRDISTDLQTPDDNYKKISMMFEFKIKT